ncbi:DUF1203 domain-containing protein [Sphingomonas sp. HDW15A]|uniref:DUF1203 domain-containing protein n=1 Tax=Sphingomonas sp. HDW15A TaxID=2714942 RepID=UPI00140C7A1E|nr:DUF1203 domain-containing protein [Sphingomonas sp. HDW15A]QIK95592.1 DUF1203 domain-containing protein [Sphingomonas sp. HDW15A]
MTYRIKGLEPATFSPLFELGDAELEDMGMTRMRVDNPNFPCRVSLRDADIGDEVILLNHVSHEGNNPYRASHAIFISKSATEAADYVDSIPPALDRRILSLRAFDGEGMMIDAAIVQPGEADPAIRRMLGNSKVDHIDAHNAIRGCFAARIDRN